MTPGMMREQIQLYKEAEEERKANLVMMDKIAKYGIAPDGSSAKPGAPLGIDSMQFAMVHGHMAMHLEFALNRRRAFESNLIVRGLHAVSPCQSVMHTPMHSQSSRLAFHP